MDLGLRGKAALVCGASRGLGFGCAEALAAAGVDLVVVARSSDAIENAAKRLRSSSGVNVVAVAADLATNEGREHAIGAATSLGLEEPGHFDILVTNAGGPPAGNFRTFERDAWLQAIDINMLAPIELIKAAIDGMCERGFGRIVNITSSSVKAPIAHLPLSNGARSGLTGIVAGVAREVASNGVTVNNLLPGAFATDRLEAFIAEAKSDSHEHRKRILGRIPARRFGTVSEFGAACAFLCSVHAGYITGQNLLMDGGAYPGVL